MVIADVLPGDYRSRSYSDLQGHFNHAFAWELVAKIILLLLADVKYTAYLNQRQYHRRMMD